MCLCPSLREAHQRAAEPGKQVHAAVSPAKALAWVQCPVTQAAPQEVSTRSATILITDSLNKEPLSLYIAVQRKV